MQKRARLNSHIPIHNQEPPTKAHGLCIRWGKAAEALEGGLSHTDRWIPKHRSLQVHPFPLHQQHPDLPFTEVNKGKRTKPTGHLHNVYVSLNMVSIMFYSLEHVNRR